MAKIEFDKYYTPPNVARFCIDKAFEIIGKDDITEIIEPSAGCGSFSHQIKDCKAYDLYPQHEYIEQEDFLKLDLGYKKGRLFIGNPPFGGSTGKLLNSFYKKCCKEGDYIAFIQPSSYYNNYVRNYIFEIVYSTIIEIEYSNKLLKTSFTIYKRNPDCYDWREEKEIELQDVSVNHYVRNNKGKFHKSVEDYDYSFVSFGQIFKQAKPYSKVGTISIKCHNPNNKDYIIKFCKFLYSYNNKTHLFDSIATNCISSGTFKKLLKECIPNIK